MTKDQIKKMQEGRKAAAEKAASEKPAGTAPEVLRVKASRSSATPVLKVYFPKGTDIKNVSSLIEEQLTATGKTGRTVKGTLTIFA